MDINEGLYKENINKADSQKSNPKQVIDESIKYKIHNELYSGGPKKISKKIIDEASKSICKITFSKMYGTGFFLWTSFNNAKLLITNYHVINRDIVNKNIFIKLEIYNKKIFILTLANFQNNIQFFEFPDITVIKINFLDNLCQNVIFLEVDMNYINGYNNYLAKDIFTLGYPFGKDLSFSQGIITDITENLFYHNCDTDHGYSGSPIILSSDKRVIGIHRGGLPVEKINIGTFLGSIFEKNYKIIYYNNNNFEGNKNKINNKLNLNPKIHSILPRNELMAAKIIQNKWRNNLIRKNFKQIKYKLLLENQVFLKDQYDICDKAGPLASDGDFNPEGWKRFYPLQDAFFNFQKGFVIPFGVKIRHPYDPQRVSVYEGDVNIDNQRHGFGRLTTLQAVYLGQWRNGEFTGWGRETRRSGKVYEGKYINGLLQGKGILKNNKGANYVGDFKDSKRHGKGILDTLKIHYEGEFRDDKLCGNGRVIFKIEGHIYEGQFDNHEINGFGTFKWKNGDSYTGNMLNGKMEGKGRYRYNNGVVYEGIYKNGVRQGQGILYDTNGMPISQV